MREVRKTRIRILICSLLLMAAFGFFSYSAYAAPSGGILRGVPSTTGTTALTDGNDATYVVTSNGSSNEFNLGNTYKIDGYYLNTSDAGISFYDPQGHLIRTFGSGCSYGTTGWYIPCGDRMSKSLFRDVTPPISNVSKVVVATGGSNYIYELELRGIIVDDMPPAIPSNLRATDGVNSVKLNWDMNTESDFNHYNIYKDSVLYSTSTTNFFDVTGLLSNKSYMFRVTAVDNSGNESALSSSVIGFSMAPLPKPVLSYTSSSSDVTLSWTDSGTGVGYEVWNVFGGQNYKLFELTDRSYKVTNLNPDSDALFFVVAKDGSGRSIQSDTLTAHTKPLPPAKPPVLQVSSKTHNQIVLSWDDLGGKYDVFLDGQSKSVQQTVQFYTFGSLQPNTTYTLKVEATDQYGRKTSASLDVTTNNIPPSVKPTLRVSSKDWQHILVAWDNSGESYEVYLNGASVGTTNVQAYDFLSLAADTDYKIKVAATDLYGRVLVSDEMTVRTDKIPAAAVTNLTSTALDHKSVRLLWTDVLAVGGYQIFKDDVLLTQTNGLFSQVNGLAASTQYRFKLKYKDRFGRDIESNELTLTTLTAPVVTPTPPPRGTPPPVSNSNNPDLNKGNDYLVEGAKDMKLSFMNMIGIVIVIIILVFGIFWILRLWKRKMNEAATTSIGAASKLNLSEGQRAERQMNSAKLTRSIRDYTTKQENKNQTKNRKKVQVYATSGKYQRKSKQGTQ